MTRWTRKDLENKIARGTLPAQGELFPAETARRSLFDNLPEITEHPEPSDEFRTITIILEAVPMPKQSVRAYAQRYMAGAKKGDVITFRNPKTGKLDVTIGFHKDPEREKRERAYRIQITKQLRDNYPDFVIFQKEVHITKYHVIFPLLESFTKRKIEAISRGEIFYHTTAPDLPDNLKKLPNDAMSGLVYTDDKIIVSENNVMKYYGLCPGYIIELKGR